MNYSQNELFDLMDQIVAQGGDHLDEECRPRTFEFSGPHELPEQDRVIVYCGHPTIFMVPYEGLDKHGDELGVQPVEVCAVDDNVAMWPRFGGDRFAAILDGRDE